MGAWGTSIFSDDVAADVRNAYNDLLGSHLVSDEEAEEMVLKAWDEVMGKYDEPVVWLSLAKAEYMKGRLSERVKQKALEVIESGINLKEWECEDKKTYAKRKQVLETLREQLTGEQPPKKKIRKTVRHVSPFKVGDVVVYHMVNGKPEPWLDDYENELINKYHGKYIIFQVAEIKRHYTCKFFKEESMEDLYISTYVYNWIGDEVPSAEILNGLKYVTFGAYYLYPSKTRTGLVLNGKTPGERLEEIKKCCGNEITKYTGVCKFNAGLYVKNILRDLKNFTVIDNLPVGSKWEYCFSVDSGWTQDVFEMRMSCIMEILYGDFNSIDVSH